MEQFAGWFAEYQATVSDEQLEADAQAGKLDELVREAKEGLSSGKCKPL